MTQPTSARVVLDPTSERTLAGRERKERPRSLEAKTVGLLGSRGQPGKNVCA